VQLLGEHRVYWEPFCGSCAALLAKEPCVMETVNDLHGDLINLARVIQDKEMGFRLYDKLRRTLYAEDLFKEAKERWISQTEISNEPDIDRAYDYFIASWMGMNGVSGTARYNCQFAIRWCSGGGQGGKRWISVLESMPAWHRRLQNVVIIRRDAFEVLDNIKDEKGTAIYCDPPYFDKSNKYIYDFSEGDHKRLSQSLQRFKQSKVIVSYYDDTRLESFYPGFEKTFINKSCQSLRNATRGPKKRPRKVQVEVLLTNFNNHENSLFGERIHYETNIQS
jgi:DNA adenine methylase